MPRERGGAGWFEWGLLALFAVLLGLVTWRHEMWIDEMQAWLIARDSHSLAALFHQLHYEGHPALWYLLLYIPAHLSANAAVMQAMNYAVAVALAWTIVSEPKLPRTARALAIFGYYVFYRYGAIARSYELGVLLLMGAARCLMGERQHRRLGLALLALAINTHVFAGPVAVALGVWAFGLAKLKTWRDAGRLPRDREFWTALAVLAASGLASLATVWPAPDIAPVAQAHGAGSGAWLGGAFLSSGSVAWQMFVPHLPARVQLMVKPLYAYSLTACAFSLAVFAVATGLLRTARARGFFAACAAMEIALMAVTVRWPDVYHFGFLFAAYAIAVLMDAYAAPGEHGLRWMPRRAAAVLLPAVLAVQVLAGADVTALDWMRPYSGAKEVSTWLKSRHLEGNPLVLEPSEFTTAIVGYLERRAAYYPSCQCFGSFEVRNNRRDEWRMATAEDLRAARGDSRLPVILVSRERLTAEEARGLGVVEVHATRQDAVQEDEDFFIYEQAQR